MWKHVAGVQGRRLGVGQDERTPPLAGQGGLAAGDSIATDMYVHVLSRWSVVRRGSLDPQESSGSSSMALMNSTLCCIL